MRFDLRNPNNPQILGILENAHKNLRNLRVRDDPPLRDALKEVAHSFTQNGRMIRALDVTGKDREPLQSIADPQYDVSGIAHKTLRTKLGATAWAKGGTDRQLSDRLSRHLRLLRDHGLVGKANSTA